MRVLPVLVLGCALLASGPVVTAQSPLPVVPSASPAASPSPVATPFPYPLVPAPSAVDPGARFEPSGPPDASVARHGVRLEAWLSSPTVAPGEWVQVAVRTTNVGRGTAWQLSGQCRTSGTSVTGDARETTPRGRPQPGNAGRLKARLTRGSSDRWFPTWTARGELDGWVVALAECPISAGPLPLRPGRQRTEHFAWYGGEARDLHQLAWQPPYPGTMPITVVWPFLGRGARPAIPRDERVRTDPIRLTLPLEITGDGPGTPSLDELVDAALADPRWRAWVDGDPTRERWGYADAIVWSGPDYPADIVLLGDLRRYGHPDGILSIELDRAGDRGFVLVDPWIAEVLDVILPSWATTASPSPPASTGPG